MIAAESGHSEAIQVLLETGAAVDLASSMGSTALHLAAFKSHEAVVRVLLAAGADPNCMNTV